MSQTKEGARKAQETMRRRYGDDLQKHYAEIGRIGGKVKHGNKGFGSNRELASEAGRIGGQSSRKKKNVY